jgi:hypothetical protein
MIMETTAAIFLDVFGFRGVCEECGGPIWWMKNKRNQLSMYTVNLIEHKHETSHKKEPVKKMIEQERRSPGGTW